MTFEHHRAITRQGAQLKRKNEKKASIYVLLPQLRVTLLRLNFLLHDMRRPLLTSMDWYAGYSENYRKEFIKKPLITTSKKNQKIINKGFVRHTHQELQKITERN